MGLRFWISILNKFEYFWKVILIKGNYRIVPRSQPS